VKAKPVAKAADPEAFTPERCAAACDKLAGCQLAQRTCRRDCERRLVPLACIEAATGCDAFAACTLRWLCPELPEPQPGGLTCIDALTCEGRCPPGGTCVCNCIKQVKASALAAFARMYQCRIETIGDSEAFAARCTPLARPCALGD
jgi:hypothetical protein